MVEKNCLLRTVPGAGLSLPLTVPGAGFSLESSVRLAPSGNLNMPQCSVDSKANDLVGLCQDCLCNKSDR